MKYRKILQSLIAIEVCLILFCIKLYLFGVDKIGLDNTLLEWLSIDEEKTLTRSDLCIISAGLLILILNVFSWVWLWMLKPYSRILYTALLFIIIILGGFMGPCVSNGYIVIFEQISLVISGLIVEVLYFTDLYPHKKYR